MAPPTPSLLSLPIGIAFSFVALSSPACQSEPGASSDQPICLTDSCEEASPPITGNAVVNCWVTPAGSEGGNPRVDTLHCRYAPPTDYPAALDGATIRGQSIRGERFDTEIGTAHAGEIRAITLIDPMAYPFELELVIRFGQNDHTVPALEGLDTISAHLTVESAGDIAPDRPASASIPFDLWEVNLLGRDADFSALSFGYSVELGSGAVHQVAFKTKPLLFGRRQTIFLPVDLSTFALDARMVFSSGTAAEASVTGPGAYSVRDGALEPATSSDAPQTVSGGSNLASCWFEGVEHGYEELYCQMAEDRGLALSGAMVEVVTGNDESTRTPVTNMATRIATVSPEAFPLSVSLVGQVQENIIGLQSLAGRSLRASAQINSKLLPRMTTRRSLEAPFSVWEVSIDNRSDGFQGALDAYVLELGDSIVDRFATLVDDSEIPFVAGSTQESFLIATPVNAEELHGSGFMVVNGQAQDIYFTLRPGTLVVGE